MYSRGSQTEGHAPGGGTVGPVGGGTSCLYDGHIYFEQNMDEIQNVHFSTHFPWFKYEACFIL
jgi:hypothetical protein